MNTTIARIVRLGFPAVARSRSSRRKPQKIQRRLPLQARAHATVDAVLEATARIVRRHGIAALTTNLIAERAGISVGTLYGYFPDKASIVTALARRILAEDRVAIRAAISRDEAGAPIRSLLRTLIALHRKDGALRRAVMSAHIGAGGGREHNEQVERVVAMVVERLPTLPGGTPLDRLRLFIATRAAVGVARALVEETALRDLEDAAVEDELVRLIEGYLQQVKP